MKKILFLISIFIIFYSSTTNADLVRFNVADFSSPWFNNWLPISTWNKAWTKIISEAWYSWSIQVSDTTYNIANFNSSWFNNWLPLSSWKKAKVVIDKTLSNWNANNELSNDSSYNIADFISNWFNNGLPINTWKKARVVIDSTKLHTWSWTFIYWDTFYNVAWFQSEWFNNWLPVNTWKKAKVLVTKVRYENWELIIDKWTNYNIAAFQSEWFNNWLPISTWEKAKVSFLKDIIYYDNEDLTITNDSWITYSNINNEQSSDGWFSRVYSNSKKYIFQAHYVNNKNINLQNISWNIYNTKSTNNTIVIWDEWLIQTVIDKNPSNGKMFNFTDNSEIIISDWEIYSDNSSILQVYLTGSVVTPPVLTYPYKVDSGSGSISTYTLKTNYPVIKWLAYPNSIMELSIWLSDKYYVKVDWNWLFEFNPSKMFSNWEYDMTFQYVMIEWDYNLTKYTDKKLLYPKTYKVFIDGTLSYKFPYITTIYNDDYIYTNLFFLEWFANPGEINYRLKTINNNIIQEWKSIVNTSTKKFKFLIWNWDYSLTNWKYIIEMWQDWLSVERKSFEVKLWTKEKIWILNIKDWEIIPTLKPTFVWYSKENIINNDTIRVFACDITWSSLDIKPCLIENRKLIWTTNASSNWLFEFTPLDALKDNRYYEIEFVNTIDSNIYKKVVIRTKSWDNNTIYNSQLTSIISWITINNNKIKVSWYTLPNTSIEINWTNFWNSDENWLFNYIVDYNSTISVKFWSNYINTYQINSTWSQLNDSTWNYIQKFNNNSENIIEIKR